MLKFGPKITTTKSVLFNFGFVKKYLSLAISILISYNHFGAYKTQIISPN
jgi:hypothetical protein